MNSTRGCSANSSKATAGTSAATAGAAAARAGAEQMVGGVPGGGSGGSG